MNVDIYRRPEPGDRFSYLLVPHGQPIPEEATSAEWQLRKQEVRIDDHAQHLDDIEIDAPRRQIDEKGYAITSVYNQVDASEKSLP